MKMPQSPQVDWQSIAENLANALETFMAYDGYGQGGAEDSNRGNWSQAHDAMDRYNEAVR